MQNLRFFFFLEVTVLHTEPLTGENNIISQVWLKIIKTTLFTCSHQHPISKSTSFTLAPYIFIHLLLTRPQSVLGQTTTVGTVISYDCNINSNRKTTVITTFFLYCPYVRVTLLTLASLSAHTFWNDIISSRKGGISSFTLKWECELELGERGADSMSAWLINGGVVLLTNYGSPGYGTVLKLRRQDCWSRWLYLFSCHVFFVLDSLLQRNWFDGRRVTWECLSLSLSAPAVVNKLFVFVTKYFLCLSVDSMTSSLRCVCVWCCHVWWKDSFLCRAEL